VSFRIEITAAIAVLTAAPCFGDEPVLRAGTDYELVRAAQPTGSPAGRIEVAEIFQYGCGGCAQFEPHLETWAGEKPEYVDLVRIPAVWNALGELHARAFYTAEALGILERIHAPFFRAVHVEGNRLENEAKLREFFSSFGVDVKAFDATFSSFAVHTKVLRAKELVTRYGIGETPSIVVNGKYLTRGGLAHTYARWFEIVEGLAAQEHGAN
jgi:protein dithiol oxidoreductase (disulfide-forming)